MEWLTTGQMVDKLKVGEIAETKEGYYTVKRTGRGIVFSDNVPIEMSEIALACKWRILPNYVSFDEAMKALKEGKEVQLHYGDCNDHFINSELLNDRLCSLSISDVSFQTMINGKWTIES